MNDTDPSLPLWLAFLALNEQATRDWLTGLYNRRYFEETLADHIEGAHRYERELSLVLFDIDEFKQINDARGHEAGDAVLKDFAERLKTSARKADIVCRYGGDEFAAILPETGADSAWILVDRVIEILNDNDLNYTVSGGVAALPSDNLVAHADVALLLKKKENRSR